MGKLVFHIGQMKSGTTFLQNIMSKNRGQLSEKGWLYPGKRFNHQHETYGICGNDIFWVTDKMQKNNYKLGKALVSEVAERRKDENILISSEALSSLDENGIDRVVAAFGKPDEVILTVRSLYKVFPSAWQQDLKGGHSRSLDKFFYLLREQRKDRSGFWKTYSYGDVVKKWSRVGPVKTIVVPESSNDPDALWHSFSTATGLPSDLDSSISKSQSNISLNVETANFVRTLIKVISQDEKFLKNKSKILRMYFEEMVFPCAGKSQGRKILPLLSYKNELFEWSKEEYSSMITYSSEIFGDPKEILEYNGEFYDSEHDHVGCEVAEETAFQIANYFQTRL